MNMSQNVCIKKDVEGSAESVVERVAGALKGQGFGVLTRIDFHSKIKEKLGKEMRPVIILGACNPTLAYEAYQSNTDVASLLPCNAVVRELAAGLCSVELAMPSAMMKILGDERLVRLAAGADEALSRALANV